MKQLIIYLSRFIIAFVFTGFVCAGESPYRLAGIIAPADTEWTAVIEMPDSKQQLVSEGDVIGEAKVLRISRTEVLLQLKEGTQLLKLASSEKERKPVKKARPKVSVTDFVKLVKASASLIKPGELPGLADMGQLPPDVRIVSINGKSISSPGAGIKILQDAINKDLLIRLKLEEGVAVPIIYLRSGTDIEVLEGS
jgi:type II secretory pathway component PulC